MRRLALLALAAGLGGPAVGQVIGSLPSVGVRPDGFVVSYPNGPAGQGSVQFGRSYGTALQDRIALTDRVRGMFPSGTEVEFNSTRTVAGTVARNAIKTLIAGGAAGIGLAAVPLLWDALKPKGIVPSSGGTANVDPGTEKTPQGGTMHDANCGLGVATPVAIADCMVARDIAVAEQSGLRGTRLSASGSCGGGTCSYTYAVSVTYNNAAGTPYATWGSTVTGPEVVTMLCPQSSLEPLVSTTGKPCPTDNRVPASPPVIDSAVESLPPATIADVIAKLDELGDRIVQAIPTSPPQTSGPSSVPEPTPTVTTRPDGSVETKTTERQLTYDGPQVRSVSVQTTTTNINNSTSTTTTVNPETTDDRAECEKSPDAIGCAKFGTPESDQVKKSDTNITFSPVSIGGAGACPPGITFEAFGSRTFEFQPLCTAVVDYVKPLVLLLGAVAAAFVFIGGLKA